jgi:hypothetical protein
MSFEDDDIVQFYNLILPEIANADPTVSTSVEFAQFKPDVLVMFGAIIPQLTARLTSGTNNQWSVSINVASTDNDMMCATAIFSVE